MLSLYIVVIGILPKRLGIQHYSPPYMAVGLQDMEDMIKKKEIENISKYFFGPCDIDHSQIKSVWLAIKNIT